MAGAAACAGRHAVATKPAAARAVRATATARFNIRDSLRLSSRDEIFLYDVALCDAGGRRWRPFWRWWILCAARLRHSRHLLHRRRRRTVHTARHTGGTIAPHRRRVRRQPRSRSRHGRRSCRQRHPARLPAHHAFSRRPRRRRGGRRAYRSARSWIMASRSRKARSRRRRSEPMLHPGRGASHPEPGDKLPLTGWRWKCSAQAAGSPARRSGPRACATRRARRWGSRRTRRGESAIDRRPNHLRTFTFLDLGDLPGANLAALACPNNLLGHADVYSIPHHGNKDTAIPASSLPPRRASPSSTTE